MSAETGATLMKDRRALLSTLWMFAVINYLYTDLAMMMFHPTAYQGVAAKVGEWGMLGFAAVMEIPIAMVLLSRALKYRVNRWMNIIAGIESTLFVAFTLVGGTAPLFYLFTGIIEMATTLFIVWYAWIWPHPESQP
jgi:MFS family permease